jgi:hypothetical protein
MGRAPKNLPISPPPKTFKDLEEATTYIRDLIRVISQAFSLLRDDTVVIEQSGGQWPVPFPIVSHMYTGQTYTGDPTGSFEDFDTVVRHTDPAANSLDVTLTQSDMGKCHANNTYCDASEHTANVHWLLPSDAKKGDVVGFYGGGAAGDQIIPAAGQTIHHAQGRVGDGVGYTWDYISPSGISGYYTDPEILVSNGDGNWYVWHEAYGSGLGP